jgi:cytidine deaminase
MSTTSLTYWRDLGQAAWTAREHARVHGPTRVGAAVLDSEGGIFIGCNVEHRFRSHDVHAEVNALTTLVAAGGGVAVAVLIAAERDRFTPCGSCLDWIFELGGPECLVAFQPRPGGEVKALRADELMPHYPH